MPRATDDGCSGSSFGGAVMWETIGFTIGAVVAFEALVVAGVWGYRRYRDGPRSEKWDGGRSGGGEWGRLGDGPGRRGANVFASRRLIWSRKLKILASSAIARVLVRSTELAAPVAQSSPGAAVVEPRVPRWPPDFDPEAAWIRILSDIFHSDILIHSSHQCHGPQKLLLASRYVLRPTLRAPDLTFNLR